MANVLAQLSKAELDLKTAIASSEAMAESERRILLSISDEGVTPETLDAEVSRLEVEQQEMMKRVALLLAEVKELTA